MAWVMILAAGLFETGFAVALKLSHGMTRLWPTVAFAVCALISFALLTIGLITGLVEALDPQWRVEVHPVGHRHSLTSGPPSGAGSASAPRPSPTDSCTRSRRGSSATVRRSRCRG